LFSFTTDLIWAKFFAKSKTNSRSNPKLPRREASDENIKVEEPAAKRVKLEAFSEQDISKLGHVNLGHVPWILILMHYN
jgi:hypothetical protein